MPGSEMDSSRHSQNILATAMGIVGAVLAAAIFYQGNRTDALASRVDTVITSQSDIRVAVAEMRGDVTNMRDDVVALKNYLLPPPKGPAEPEKTDF